MTEESKPFQNCYIGNVIEIDKDQKVIYNGKSRDFIINIVTKGIKTHITLDINYYENIAAPRMINDTNKIEITSNKVEKIIKEIFTCSFCMGIFDDPVNIRSCLHKYCKKCIEDYIRTV
jgi:hypothetical protein